MCQDLLNKHKNVFLDHFARLGIFHKIQRLVGISPQSAERESSTETEGEDEIDNSSSASGSTASGDKKVNIVCAFLIIELDEMA